MKLISRKHTIILAAVAVLFTLLPYVHTLFVLGESPRVPVGIYNDTDYYYDRMREVKDGYPFLGNPYFYEHRKDPAPAFFVADWISAVPMLLGATLMETIHGNLLFWSFVFLLLTYALMVILGFPKAALLGAILSYLELYLFIIRPVSMQVIFPFFILFLIAYVLWLKDPRHTKKMFFLALAGALSAYVYTYLWQIVVVAFMLTPLVFFVTARKSSIAPALKVFGIFILASLPLIIYTLRQVAALYYWETMERVGLIYTHLPTAAALYASIPIVLLFAAGMFIRRADHYVPTAFFAIVGFSSVAVIWSNVITGKDLELPQHIERFVIFLLALGTACLLSLIAHKKYQVEGKFHLALALVLSVCIIAVNVRYLWQYGPVGIPGSSYGAERSREIQAFEKPLSWLEANVPNPSVVWGDPNGKIIRYVTMFTPHYVLWRAGGALHLVSNKEVEERYLAANYFHLTPEDLIANYQEYGGVGNSHHIHKTHNRKVKLCMMLGLRHFMDCGVIETAAGYKGQRYFDDLYRAYQKEIRPFLSNELQKFNVSYIISDTKTDTSYFKPENLPNVKRIYDDGRFSIYRR